MIIIIAIAAVFVLGIAIMSLPIGKENQKY
jgi:hypothetical protein